MLEPHPLDTPVPGSDCSAPLLETWKNKRSITQSSVTGICSVSREAIFKSQTQRAILFTIGRWNNTRRLKLPRLWDSMRGGCMEAGFHDGCCEPQCNLDTSWL